MDNKQIIAIRKKYFPIMVNTARINRNKVANILIRFRELKNFSPPTIVWCESPNQAQDIYDMVKYLETARKLRATDWIDGCIQLGIQNPLEGKLLVEELKSLVKNDNEFITRYQKNFIYFSHYGGDDACLLAEHEAYKTNLDEEIKLYLELVYESGWIADYKQVIFVCDRPVLIQHETPDFASDEPPLIKMIEFSDGSLIQINKK